MSELDKTIEELEEEIIDEMKESSSADSEKELDEMMKKEKMKKEEEEDEEEVDEMKMVKSSKKMKEEEEDEDEEEKNEEFPPKKDDEEDEDEKAEMHKKEKMKKEMMKKKVKEDFEARLSQVDVTDDVEALTSGEELSEEFKEKASVIFEAAVKSKLREEVERIEEEKEREVQEYIDVHKDELVEKVDKYLNYVVEQWMSKNQLAVERGLKGEIAEDFISGLRTLFEEHYIEVPNEKYDILESQSEKLEEMEQKLNEEIQKNVDLKSQVSTHIKDSIFVEVSEDLSDTEKEKFKSLAEDLEFIDEESFSFKLNSLKESYFPKTKIVSESVDHDAHIQESEISDSMAKYVAAISKNIVK